MARFPFIVAFAYTRDETNHFADILLPDATDLESLQLIRIGGSKYIEQFWEHEGYALRQPAVAAARRRARLHRHRHRARARAPACSRNTTRRSTGRRRGAAQGRALGLLARRRTTRTRRDEIWDAVCRAASAELTDGKETHDLDWWKEHGLAHQAVPAHPTGTCSRRSSEKGLRFELPYQERLLRVGTELGRRLHEHDMHWWDKQLAEYQALPAWKDFPTLWDAALEQHRRHAGGLSRSGCSPRAACSTPGAATSACS